MTSATKKQPLRLLALNPSNTAGNEVTLLYNLLQFHPLYSAPSLRLLHDSTDLCAAAIHAAVLIVRLAELVYKV
jgi:hypothetical protein